MILGGGLLGLTLALELSKQNKEIAVFEQQSTFGGLAGGFKIGNNYLEKYYHHIFRSDNDIQDLIQELGLSDKLNWYPATSGVWDDKNLYSFSTSLDILKFRLLNIFDRVRLGLVSLYLQKFAKLQNVEKYSALDWSKKYFGKKVTQTIWEPLLRGKFASDAEKVSMGWLWARIFDRSSSRPNMLAKEELGYLDGSFQLLIDTLIEKLKSNGVKLFLKYDLQSYEFNKNLQKHKVIFKAQDNKKRELEFDQVISTLPGPLFIKLFQGVNAEIKKEISQIKYLGAICLTLVIKDQFMPYYWLSVMNSELPFLAVIEHTNFINPDKYEKKHILYIAKYLSPENKLFSASQNELLKIYLPYLQKINPAFDETWIEEVYFASTSFAQHIVNVDYQIPKYETNIPGLYFTNFSQVYPHDRGMNYAVRQGKELAGKIEN